MTDSKISDDISVISSVDEPLSDEDYVPQKKTVREIEIISVEKSYSDYVSNKRRTLPYINKYERAKILGIRAQQIAGGAEPLIKVPPGLYDVIEIAERELKEKKTPFIVKRTINNNFEYWKIEDLEILN